MASHSPNKTRRPGRGNGMKVALAFVDRINSQDVEGLCELMTEDHRFVDPTGAVHVGRERMREGWRHYFAMSPDYRITISKSFSSGVEIAFFGTTSATYAPNGVRVEMHAALLAVVHGKQIAEWRVCAD